MRSMTGEGGAAHSMLKNLRNTKRPHPSRFTRHLLPPVREKEKKAPFPGPFCILHTTVLDVSASAGFWYHFSSMRHSTLLARSVSWYSVRMYGSSIQ